MRATAKRVLFPLAALLVPAICAAAGATPDERDSTLVVRFALSDEAITPVSANFIRRVLREADESGATAVVFELDTPGGLMSSTQQIVRDIIASPVPVLVFVAPPGARAASAGVFITLAGHVAAMSPGTHIGAAHPVSIGGMPGDPQSDNSSDSLSNAATLSKKVVNDAVAWVRSIAEMRGRNADWAEKAVTESLSITSTEAVAIGVVDLLADDVPALLKAVDGDTVALRTGPHVLKTSAARVETVAMWWGERLLAAISNPNLAFLLLVLGFYGLLFEFYTPGWGVAGTVGAICIVLAFFGLAFLPVNYAGLALLILGLGLFVAEAFVHSFGALTLGGLVCVILGGLMLVDSPVGVLRVSALVVVPVGVATALIAFFLVGSVVKAHRSRVQTGTETMTGSTAVTTRPLIEQEGKGFVGTVRHGGELWRAVAEGAIDAGEQVEVVRRDGLTLFVRRL